MLAPLLPWLSDETFIPLVEDVLRSGFAAAVTANKNLERNVIDPFLMLFELGSFHLDIASWITNETMRQSQKTLSNKIGLFHQNVLGSLAGWKNLGTREVVDLANEDKRIITEIKNKHNTIKKSDQIGLYTTLNDLVMPKTQKYRGYTAYYVEIVPRRAARYDVVFTPPDRTTGTQATTNSLIRRIDGASFYALASGHEHALAQLYDALPTAIEISLRNMRIVAPDLDRSLLHRYFTHAYGQQV